MAVCYRNGRSFVAVRLRRFSDPFFTKMKTKNPSNEILKTKLHALEVRLDERYKMQQQAVDKAFETLEIWKQGSNEWRAALNDGNAKFLTRNEYHPAHNFLVEKITVQHDALNTRVDTMNARLSQLEGKSMGLGTAVTTIFLIIGVIISLVVGGFSMFGPSKTILVSPAGVSSLK